MDQLQSFIRETWQASIVPALQEYIAIPNESPAFDAQWREHGHMDRAVDLFARWAKAQNVPGLDLQVARAEGRTPVLIMEIPGSGQGTVLLYGHLDKQPPMEGWRPELGPWTPVLEDGRLYGRGGADDGYGMFAALTAVKALKLESIPCARCVILIEACEESGSFDLPHYVNALADRIGTPDLVVCLDSGCGDYERMWVTTSLRGVINATLSVSTLTEGVHSGAASGIVPSSFRILRRLLSRLEDENTGQILPRDLHVEIPPDRLVQAKAAAQVLGAGLHENYPFHPGTTPVGDDVAELLLNRTWRPQLEIIGAAGLPTLEQAGNVLRPETRAKLSLRLPPTADPGAAVACLRDTLTKDPPYQAKVTFDAGQGTGGWNAPPFQPWLEDSMTRASREFFGKDACATGEGGTIPFMAMLAEKFPEAQFMITGVLGPKSNAHGPNEFLHLETAMNLTGCVARVLHTRPKHRRVDMGYRSLQARILPILCCLVIGVSTLGGPSSSLAAEDMFFKDKTIRILVAFSVGGGFDIYSRTIGRHMGRYIPGNPRFLVQNMTGAGGLISANYLYRKAKPDGLTIGISLEASFGPVSTDKGGSSSFPASTSFSESRNRPFRFVRSPRRAALRT